MFQSKVPLLVRNLVNKIQHDNSVARIVQCRYMSDESNDNSVQTTGNPDKLYKKIELEMKANEPAILQSYAEFISMAAKHLDLNIGRSISLRKPVHDRWTVLKSAHIYKKHRVQYEIRTYFHYIDLLRLTGSTADTVLEYFERNLPEGVAMKVTKVEIQQLPKSLSIT